ncbi:MAG: tyrosine-protein phosphatase [Novosphingobium sp.]|nr:tyrosine-protein phosphatase [Novosphingobium sp.]
MADARILVLEGVHNFRDYGGYPLAGGGRVRRGLLWRSGQHATATEADLARIGALDLAAVFDLRNGVERERQPCRRPAGFAGKIHFHDEDAAALAPHVAAAQIPPVSGLPPRERMRLSYRSIAFRFGLAVMIRRQLAWLAEGEGASLVNCMAGKDRTGFAVAMIQCALGVHPDDIMADYLLTNMAGDVDARIAAGMVAMQATGAARKPLDAETLRVLMSVEAEYLDTAMASIREKFGSIDAYLEQELGADAALRGKLRERLAES